MVRQKTPKIMGCCRANFAFLHALKIGTFRGKWTLEWVIKTSHFVLLALYFLITSKLALSLIASQRCLARTAKKVWVKAQNSAKNNFLPLRLETYLAWTFLFPCSFLNNYPWTSEKNSFFNKLWVLIVRLKQKIGGSQGEKLAKRGIETTAVTQKSTTKIKRHCLQANCFPPYLRQAAKIYVATSYIVVGQ